MKEIGLYVHIPFCKAKCYYCDFVSFANLENIHKEYIECVKKEIYKYSNENKIMHEHKNEELYKISTIYIGGGTPSILDEKLIIDLLKEVKNDFCISEDVEITIEINPGTVNKQKLEAYKNIGINRLSIGLQTCKNSLLKQIGRIHTYKQFETAYKEARNVGFLNINIDVMIGLPNQSLEDVKDTIKKVRLLNPEHISIYSLIVEEKTKLANMLEEKTITLPEEEEERKMYWYAKKYLEKYNYIHYEISNFSKTGYESKHNLDCWKQKEYIGVGLAASSFLENKRYSNITNLEKYIKNINNNEQSKNLILEENLNTESKMKEYMLLGLRKISGVNINQFKQIFNISPIIKFCNELNKLSNLGLIIVDKNDIKLTNKGLDLANVVWQEFI